MGDTIVLGINMNEDARNSPLALKIKSLKSKDVVLSLYPFAPPQATFNWNLKREYIEVFLVRKSDEVAQAGYISFDRD